MHPFNINSNDRIELAVALPAILILAGELAERAGDALIFGKFGLNVAQYGVLSRLAVRPQPPSMTELKSAIFLQRSASAMTGMIDDLERRGLVRRIAAPTDRRVNLIEITPEGSRLLGEINQHYVDVMREVCKDYALPELQVTVDLLRRFSLYCAATLGVDLAHPNADTPNTPSQRTS